MIIRSAAIVAVLSALLASCGGGGSPGAPPVSSQPAPTPSPSPSPTPSTSPSPTSVVGTKDKIVYAASQSGKFADEGRYFTDGGLTVRFDSSTGFYFASDPANTTPVVIGRLPGTTPPEGQPYRSFVSANGVYITALVSGDPNFPQENRYLHSNLLLWTFKDNNTLSGATAIGLPTTEGTAPTSGVTVYRGAFYVVNDVFLDYEGTMVRDGFEGIVELTFDAPGKFARLSILPRPGDQSFKLASANPIEITWSAGSSTFYQPDPASATSKNYPVSGRFTGPAAEELIGGLRFSYVSPADGKTHQAQGAFVAKR